MKLRVGAKVMISIRVTIPGDMIFFFDHPASKTVFRQDAGDHRPRQTSTDDHKIHFSSVAVMGAPQGAPTSQK